MVLQPLFNAMCGGLAAFSLWKWGTPQQAAAYAYCATGLISMAFSTCIVWYRRPPFFPLPDIGHDLLPTISTVGGIRAHAICDHLLCVTMLTTLLFIIKQPRRIIILTRCCMIYGTIMFMRAVTLIITSLPDPYFLCATHTDIMYTWTNMPWKAVFFDLFLLLGFSPNSQRHFMTCGDMVFSGHTVLFVMCALVVHTYYKATPSINTFKLSMWTVSIIGTTLLLITKMHWTLDIVLAYYITITCWNFYHSVYRALDNGYYIKSVIWIDGVFIYPFIAWIETGCIMTKFWSRNNSRRPKSYTTFENNPASL